MTWTQKQQAVSQEVARHRALWGETFGLRAFPGEKFQVVEAASFYSQAGVQLYLYRWVEEESSWLASTKGSPDELHCQSVKISGNKGS